LVLCETLPNALVVSDAMLHVGYGLEDGLLTHFESLHRATEGGGRGGRGRDDRERLTK
jgi:hypothetical protein